MHKQFLETLAYRLQNNLPGRGAQQKMAPQDRGEGKSPEHCRNAAVLILLYPHKDDLYFVLMKRNEYDGPHSAQISLPGGMKEASDRDFMQTALRETEEEIGVAASEIEILGQLTELFIPVSNFCVFPFVGWINRFPDFHPDPSEVQYLIQVSISKLKNPENMKKGSIEIHSRTITTPFYEINKEIVWGATAMILSEFKELID